MEGKTMDVRKFVTGRRGDVTLSLSYSRLDRAYILQISAGCKIVPADLISFPPEGSMFSKELFKGEEVVQRMLQIEGIDVVCLTEHCLRDEVMSSATR
ncbi:hypothetical protein J6590_023018 [Homalodisca vitripennis]|nr:hypothetical protein J6590_023018 [Homalodisca vitripennis]